MPALPWRQRGHRVARGQRARGLCGICPANACAVARDVNLGLISAPPRAGDGLKRLLPIIPAMANPCGAADMGGGYNALMRQQKWRL